MACPVSSPKYYYMTCKNIQLYCTYFIAFPTNLQFEWKSDSLLKADMGKWWGYYPKILCTVLASDKEPLWLRKYLKMFLKRSCSIYSIKIDSQPYAVAKREIFWRATGQSNLANGMELLHWPAQCSCVISMKTKLWKLLLRPAVCMPSLIVQWPARIVHFQLLCMIVKLACSNLILGLTSDRMSIFALKTLKLEQLS